MLPKASYVKFCCHLEAPQLALLNGSVIPKLARVPTGFHVRFPITDWPLMLNLYCVMRFVFASYVKLSLSEEAKVIWVGRLAALYTVALNAPTLGAVE